LFHSFCECREIVRFARGQGCCADAAIDRYLVVKRVVIEFASSAGTGDAACIIMIKAGYKWAKMVTTIACMTDDKMITKWETMMTTKH